MDQADITTRSEQLLARARGLMPGGVSSPVRAFGAVGGEPFFVDRAEGAYLWDVDGRRYIDLIMSWGALILGHAHPSVVRAVQDAVLRGTSYGAPCVPEVELAELVVELVPSVEVVRFVNSGTEATMSAIRLARAATGRDVVVKFDGCYHGHADSFLVRAGSGVATFGLPDSPGVPADLARLTLGLPYNDADAVEAVFARRGAEIACVILEPIVGNAGFIQPEPGFLRRLREVTALHGALLVFDEVMTGFRVALGGAQERFGIVPDLTTLGKIVGGGLPVGAYGGRRDLMGRVSPSGPVYQAGTLSGNPLAMVAGVAQLLSLRESRPHAGLEARGHRLVAALREQADGLGVPLVGDASGGMFGLHFAPEPPRDFAAAKRSDPVRFRRFFHACLDRDVLLPPSPFEAAFLSTMHDDIMIEDLIDRMCDALAEVAP
ncbi:MAG: glutamate-1-semialdehyde 2,1-aminomutase [Longimicrobiales bacterium]